MAKSSGSVVTKSIKKRMLITVGLIVCGFCIVIFTLTRISLIQHNELSAAAADQQLRDTVVPAKRGTIYDTNMNVLAESAPVWTVVLSPMSISDEDAPAIATGLSQILEVDYQTVLDKCAETNYYSVVKRKVDQPIIEEIRQYMLDNELGGVNYIEDAKRYYPYGNFLAQVLGFVGTDNQGLSGIEAYYDKDLSGTPGRLLTAKNAVGSDMYYDFETSHDPVPGNSLVLTIDEVIQHYLEKSLETAVIEHNVQNKALGIVMNVKTGDILAMSVKPDYDPNDPFTIFDASAQERLAAITDEDERSTQLGLEQQSQWRNKAISDNYEPGSVFKVVTASTALETGASTLDSTYYCSNSVQVGPHTMHCASGPHGSESFVQATINSCNPAFIAIGQAIGISDFCKYVRGFGFGVKTGIDLPGEAEGMILSESQMGIVELSSCAFGQSNTVTPIQMITAVSAAANGGYLVQPRIVRQIVDAEGNIVKNYDTEIKRQVISNETSEEIAAIMEQVVLHANGQNAYVAGFRIGGKSGTAQDLTSSEVGKYWASFVAVAPTDDPEIAILIVLDNARSEKSIYGGILVAPIVGSIMRNVLPYIGVDAVYTEEELETVDIATPDVTGRTLTSAYAYLQPLGLSYTIIGEGTTVLAQYPLVGQSVPRGSKVLLYTDESEQRTATVPDVSGKSISAAQTELELAGLNIRTSGATAEGSVAASQSVAEGEVIPAGSVVTVEFVDNSIND